MPFGPPIVPPPPEPVEDVELIITVPANPPSGETGASSFPTPDTSITITGEGIIVGKLRSYDEDDGNTQKRQGIQTSVQKVTLVQSRNILTAKQPATKPVVPLTTKSAITAASITSDTAVYIAAAAARQASVKPKDNADITRSNQKLQRRCNHSYSKIINRCVFCNKKRSSHVYDV